MYRLWRTCTSHVGVIEPVLKSFESRISSAALPLKKSPAVTFKSRKVSKYGGRFTVAMFPGDGIGPEMMGYVKEMFRYGGVPVDFEVIEMDSRSDHYEDLDNAITAVKRNGVAIKGNIETRLNRPHVKSRNVEMRTQLDLYANVIPCKSYSGINSRHKDIDLIIIRQNTEGEYSMLEHESNSGIVESLKIITRDCSRKVAKFAFDYAVKYDRKKVTIVHKANIMKLSDGLFLESCLDIAKEYPQIEHESMIIDNCCMQLVSRPQQFDVMLMPNLYGTVVSNVACGLVGGPGLSSGRNYGDNYAVFETGTRNTGSGIVGRNIANPCAMINASADLLDYLGLKKHSQVIRDAVQRTISVDNLRTPDLGGQSTTSEVAQNIIKIVHETTKDLSWMIHL